MSYIIRTGAQALVESLERAGVETLFGYPGGNVVDIFGFLRDSKMKFVLGRHEQGCVHMADGYARASGKPGVILVTSGPGATNAITGLATANVDSVPLVLVSGQVPLSQIGTDAFQEADMTGICRAVTKHSFLLKSADEIPQAVAEAFYIATRGKPGAVVIDLPHDVQLQKTAAQYPERISLRAYHPDTAPKPRAVAQLAKLINSSNRPIIYAGGGVISSGASNDLRTLSAKADIPVVTTLMGLGVIEKSSAHAVGMAGMYGTEAANKALAESDLIIALGTRFSDRMTSTLKPKGKIVHVDCDPSSIEKNISVNLGIVADIKDLITTVSSRIKPNVHSSWMKRIAQLKRSSKVNNNKSSKIHPGAVIEAVAQVVGEDAIIVTDVGQHQMFAARYYPTPKPRRFLSPGGMGTMGFAIPAAIGASLSMPNEKVVALIGDGGAQMTFNELKVAYDENLPIMFIVFNNSSLGMIERMGKNSFVGNFTNPDFVMMAKAMGLKATRVASVELLKSAVGKAIKSNKPSLLEVIVDADAKI